MVNSDSERAYTDYDYEHHELFCSALYDNVSFVGTTAINMRIK